MAEQGFSEAITLGDLLLRSAARVAERRVLVMPDEAFTYAQLQERAVAIARGLIGLGVRHGDHVGYLLPNGPDAAAAIFGISLAGAVIVPINNRYRATEIGYLTENADLVAILTNDAADDYVDYYGLLCDALPGAADAADPFALAVPGAPRLRSLVLLGGKQAPGAVSGDDLARLAATVSDEEFQRRRSLPRIRDVAMILYTSGTTANPSGALVTHEAIVRDWVETGRRMGATEDSRVWNPCPLFHIAAVGVLVLTVSAGASMATARFFEADSALELVLREQSTLLYPAYPPITLGLLNHPDWDPAKLPSAHTLLSVAPPDTQRVIQALIPQAVLMSVFGMTETCGVVTIHRLDDSLDVRAGTCGDALPGTEVRVVDPESGEDNQAGVPGEILVRGMNRFEGYYRDPEKTARSIDADGWFHTGDRGVMDAAGRLQFLGRLKEMLKVGGENVAPAEIEALLSTHPAVHLVQVVGVPDQRLDEVPAAFVERKPGAELTEEDVLDYCRGSIARFKIPRYVRFVDEWPMSATKVQKFRLRAGLMAELELEELPSRG